MALNIHREVARMKRMPTADLREHFETVCGEPPRSRNRDWLVKKIAWRMQANEEGGLPERVRQQSARHGRRCRPAQATTTSFRREV